MIGILRRIEIKIITGMIWEYNRYNYKNNSKSVLYNNYTYSNHKMIKSSMRLIH